MLKRAAVLFVDRDGTLIEEPPDEQVDSLAKVKFMPGVFAAMTALRDRGFRFAMVTNQDGLGTASLPRDAFEPAHQFVLDTFASQGVVFDAVFICPHFAREACACTRKEEKSVVPGKGVRTAPSTRPPAARMNAVVSRSSAWPKA